MSKQYSDELEWALARPDAEKLTRQIDAYAKHNERGSGEWPDNLSDDFAEIMDAPWDDPEKAFAYVVLAAGRSNDTAFLALIGCGILEDILRDPSPELLARILAEARKSARFRWLLSHPYKVAIAPGAWKAIQKFRVSGPHEEPSAEILPRG